jgi:Ca-activated chloride channel family protein
MSGFAMSHAISRALPRARYLVAASLAVLVVGSAMLVHLEQSPFAPSAAPPAYIEYKDRLRTGDANLDLAARRVVPAVPAPPVLADRRKTDGDVLGFDATRGGIAVEQKLRQENRPAPLAPPPARIDGLVAGKSNTLSYAARDQLQALQRQQMPDAASPREPLGSDKFAGAPENGFKVVRETPVSTFSIDVDTASY